MQFCWGGGGKYPPPLKRNPYWVFDDPIHLGMHLLHSMTGHPPPQPLPLSKPHSSKHTPPPPTQIVIIWSHASCTQGMLSTVWHSPASKNTSMFYTQAPRGAQNILEVNAPLSSEHTYYSCQLRFPIIYMFAMFMFHAWAFPIYPGNSIEIIFIILEISGNFNARGCSCF